ncbi:hypothetical protein ACFTUC_12615 [Streptomyces sp. NPDC056944]|uniref:hypothetical protein n=1 Tax=Streptomyces sp. NPDC056944 TaxID=3345972 RepID=UPI00363E0C08
MSPAVRRRPPDADAPPLVHGRTAEEALVATDRLVSLAGVDAHRLRPVGADFTRLEEVEHLATHVVRLCDPAVEIVNGASYDRDQRVAPAPAACEARTVTRLAKLADLLVGQSA